MKVSDELEVGSAVFFKCSNPATGFIKRLAKDKSWADVEWHYGLNCKSVRRNKTIHLVKLTPILNRYLGTGKL